MTVIAVDRDNHREWNPTALFCSRRDDIFHLVGPKGGQEKMLKEYGFSDEEISEEDTRSE